MGEFEMDFVVFIHFSERRLRPHKKNSKKDTD